MNLKLNFKPAPPSRTETGPRKPRGETFRGLLSRGTASRRERPLGARCKFAILISAGLILCLAGLAPAAPPAALPDPNGIRYKPLSFEPPRAERLLLENGLVLYVLSDKELPLVKVKVVLNAGSMYDPPGREGVAELTAAMLGTGGITGMNGDDVDETLESIAATFHASANRESGLLSFSVLKKDLERGFGLFARILTEPAFEETKLALVKGLKLEELRRVVDDPQKLAFREFGRLIHRGSPRGRVATSASIRSVQREDLINSHKRFYIPSNVMISISGDIEIKEARLLVERHLGGWSPPGKRPDPLPLPSQTDGGVYFLSKDVPQSIVIFGWLAPAKKEAQFHPFEVLDFIVGSGGFRSRIFQEIRTDLGLAYSTGSFYNPKKDYGLFGAYAMTKSESTVTVLSRIAEIFREIGRKPVSEGELAGAKKAILNSFIFSFTSSEQIAFQQLMIEYEELPKDHLRTYRPNIEKVKAADLLAAAARLSPEKAILLVVGNEEAYRESVKKFGKVTRIEANP